MRVAYPSDVTRAEFEAKRHYFDTARKITHPITIGLYDIFCAVLYVLREGCRWRSLPHDYLKWQNCYKHYRLWAKKRVGGKRIFDKALEELVVPERIIKGRNPKPILSIAESKSVNNAFISDEKGYGGYTGEPFADAIMKLINAEVEIAKRNEHHTFAVIPMRWLVERTFAWLEHFRRLWKNFERKIENTLQMTTSAFIALLLKRW